MAKGLTWRKMLMMDEADMASFAGKIGLMLLNTESWGKNSDE